MRSWLFAEAWQPAFGRPARRVIGGACVAPCWVAPGVDTLLAIAVCVVSGCGRFSKVCALLVPYCPVWVVGGYGDPVKEREGTPAYPYCPAKVVGGCGRPARDRKDVSCGSQCFSCLPGNLRWLSGDEGVHSVAPPGSRTQHA